MWNLSRRGTFNHLTILKKTKQSQAALTRIKEALENDYEDLPKFTGIILILFWYHPFNEQTNPYFKIYIFSKYIW